MILKFVTRTMRFYKFHCSFFKVMVAETMVVDPAVSIINKERSSSSLSEESNIAYIIKAAKRASL